MFEFVNSTITLSEEGSPLAQAFIKRTSGLLGTVAVEVAIIEARADGTKRKLTPCCMPPIIITTN